MIIDGYVSSIIWSSFATAAAPLFIKLLGSYLQKFSMKFSFTIERIFAIFYLGIITMSGVIT